MTQSARVDESTGRSLQPFTYYMYTSDSSQPSTVKRLKNIIQHKQYTQSDRQINFILKYILVIYFSIYQMYNNCYSLARVWAACDTSNLSWKSYGLVLLCVSTIIAVYFRLFLDVIRSFSHLLIYSKYC